MAELCRSPVLPCLPPSYQRAHPIITFDERLLKFNYSQILYRDSIEFSSGFVCCVCCDVAGSGKVRAPWVRGSERDFTWGQLVTCPPYSDMTAFLWYKPKKGLGLRRISSAIGFPRPAVRQSRPPCPGRPKQAKRTHGRKPNAAQCFFLNANKNT